MPPPSWLLWGRQIEALAQNGLTYAENPFDQDRYRKLHELAVEILAAHTGEAAEVVEPLWRVQPGYATPKVDVRGACFREGQVLLVREKSDGRWCLPGGWADVGDVPSEAAVREVQEEAGFACRAQKVIAVFDCNRLGGPPEAVLLYHAFKVIFLCEITGGAPNPDHEILEVGFFGPNALPPLSQNRTDARMLAECFAHLVDPARPTAFD